MNLKDYIATIPDYPKEGIEFRDISPLMADGNAYSYAVREIVQYATDKQIDMIVGPEARGFIVGCPVAFELGIGFAPVRKPGKLPREVISADYEKEYGVEFKEVDISKNQEFAANYQVEKTPDLFLLYREKNNEPLMTRFGNGLHTIQDLKDGVLASLYTFKKVPKDILEY